MKGQSFRASRGGGGDELNSNKDLRVKNGTTNLLLSLIINERSKLPALRAKGGGERTKFKQGFRSREWNNESSNSFSNNFIKL